MKETNTLWKWFALEDIYVQELNVHKYKSKMVNAYE